MTQRTPGADALRATLRRLARVITAQPEPPAPDAPQPASDWDRAVGLRLLAIERTLSNQNRLLLMSLLGIAADIVLKLVK